MKFEEAYMERLRKPKWLRVKKNDVGKLGHVNRLIDSLGLNTVCKEANCPNRLECYAKKTATFMILGSVCTRNCKFCNVTGGEPQRVDPDEPRRVADAVVNLELKHAVITSVTRDDLDDGGAEQFAKVIRAIKEQDEKIIVEVLIPDFRGDQAALETVLRAKPDILNHNVETVSRLYDDIRPEADYVQSLDVLKHTKAFDPTIYTKSGIMVGVGEKEDEVLALFKDLVDYDCDFLTIGQYLQPSDLHYQIREYIHPDTFDMYKEEALKAGLKFVASAPLVRSSYNAQEFFEAMENNKY